MRAWQDPYYGECSAFLDAVMAGKKGEVTDDSAIADDDEDENTIGYAQKHEGILSSFRDACGTYALTWWVHQCS